MNMKLWGVLVSVLALSGMGQAAEKKGPTSQAQAFLDHADDLGLTSEQKAKLEEIAKVPSAMSVLTPEQRKKVKEIMAAGKGAAPVTEKKSKTDEAKPSDVKKTDDKKPDESKPDEKKPDATK
jgi:Spy/CpxP family protein refolding chaperone